MRCPHPLKEVSALWVTENGIPVSHTTGGADKIHQEFYCLQCGGKLSAKQAADRGYSTSSSSSEKGQHAQGDHSY